MTISLKRILLSGAVLVFAVAAIAGATGAFFSDSEVSSGNTFTAGAIDLLIDNTSYKTDANGVLVPSPLTSWASTNLDQCPNPLWNEESPEEISQFIPCLFFNFGDVKPGDRFEDTISITVNDNNAYACMDVTLNTYDDNSSTEPELDELGETQDDPQNDLDGELQNELNFVFWADDGDNVKEVGEPVLKEGNAATIFSANALPAQWVLADSTGNAWGAATGTPLTGAQTYYVAKYACYGVVTDAQVAQDQLTTRTPISNGEVTGFNCNGAPASNIGQTDDISLTFSFFAVQSRNNSQFACNPVQIEENVD